MLWQNPHAHPLSISARWAAEPIGPEMREIMESGGARLHDLHNCAQGYGYYVQALVEQGYLAPQEHSRDSHGYLVVTYKPVRTLPQ
jgi:hypothetical protein